MKEQVENWLNQNLEGWETKNYLLAVSGGRDSSVLCDVFAKLGLNFRIAHCNFQLRGSASEQDEAFVQELAAKLSVPFFCKRFETQKILDAQGGNLQETARKLRYEWFDKLIEKHQLDYVCVGTQFNDSVETLFMNIMRGSGLNGLRGIQPVKGNILRPLINVTRDEIDVYLDQHQIDYREDASNASNKYIRNRWRNEVFPIIKEMYPHFNTTLKSTIEHLNSANELVNKEVSRIAKHLIIQRNNQWLINIPLLKDLKPLNLYLYESLRAFDFNASTINDLCESGFSQPGKQFNSPSHVLTIDRNYLIITKQNEEVEGDFTRMISLTDRKIDQPISLKFSLIDPGTINPRGEFAYLDVDKLKFPLTLRKWKSGDKFRPFGMMGNKKVSDYLIDNKMPLPEKNNQFVLLSGQDIIWLVGLRIDDRYAVKKSTKKVYFVELMNMK